jgi:exodeoxyribonuclease V alpha subunit
MSAYAFKRHPIEHEDTPWRPLDRALARWVAVHGGSTQLARVAAWTSFVDGQGDTALPLGSGVRRHGLPLWSDDEIVALRAQPMVGDGAAPSPFVLDRDGRFYLWRNYAAERDVARLVAARRAAARAVQADPAGIDLLFGHAATPGEAAQREAVARVGGRRLFVLSGGPGTGKTTTVLRMLLMLQRQAVLPLDLRVCAPTGKAAQRLLQALQQGRAALAARQPPLPKDWRGLLERLPDGEALTLHRLLGFDPRRNRFGRGPQRPVAADVVVVDEASMIDLGMLRALLRALRPDSSLILIGDADQLTSVAAGSVLMDLVAALDGSADLVRLTHSFRAEAALAAINEAVRCGDRAALTAACDAAGPRFERRSPRTAAELGRELRRWAGQLASLAIRPCLPAHDHPQAPSLARAALSELASLQLLCALREDSFGALAVNQRLEQMLRQAWQVAGERLWYPGRAVIVVRNDYAAGLFNGDIGLCLADASGRLRVWFETVDEAGRPSARAIAPAALPAHEGAFAITVHKAQGSEYRRAALLLPPDADNRVLSRQLLYTGLSRARESIELWAEPAALEAALGRPVRRAGGLAARLGPDQSVVSTS